MQPIYRLNQSGEVVIENYNDAKPFSSFLPSIAGLYGKPMWAFYVNRGQGLATFGVNNKDCAILEFIPANRAYRQTTTHGFRTFIKIKDLKTGEVAYHEPFRPIIDDGRKTIKQKMLITSYDFKLEEINEDLGIKVEVMYCTLPGEFLSALLREVRITNISGRMIEVEVLDGLPIILPYYLTNTDIKEMSNLRQAWMGVEHHDTIPFYKIKVLPYDTPETVFIEGGNFYLNFGFNKEDKIALSKTIVEPALVFGSMTDLTYPESYFNEKFSFPAEQVAIGTTPCGFGYKKITLEGGMTDTAYTLVGNCDSFEKIQEFAGSKLSRTYILNKITENKRVIEGLKNNVLTSSSSSEFDLYCGQSYLDNSLRGGYPVALGDKKQTFYVYSRKHGDMEREYNFFQIDSTYFSQGNSNFRDVNQNRRNDVRFSPFVKDNNIKTFFNLIQLDGFNPLVVKGSRFKVGNPDAIGNVLEKYVSREDSGSVAEFLKKPYTPGNLLGFIESHGVKLLDGSLQALLDDVADQSEKEDMADFGEGYWVDHWTYNTDLIEEYTAIYPDRLVETLFDTFDYTYFDSEEVVAPRERKYVLTGNGVRQLGSVVKVPDKVKIIKARGESPNLVRTEYGKGRVYKTNLISKIVCLLVNKAASLDYNGVGIEMESNKPGWCDALNGLPAILGSSIDMTAEVKRLSLLMLDILKNYPETESKTIKVPSEVFDFYRTVNELLSQNVNDFEYWERSCAVKEDYRSKTVFGISGEEKEIRTGDLTSFLEALVKKLNQGLDKAFNKESGVYYTYFINEVTEYEIIRDNDGNPIKDQYGYSRVKALKFKQRPIPYYLEGPVHILRIEKDPEKARNLYNAIRKTGLYDEELKMYKVNDNIMDETNEIGRQNVFPRGWLENEAVFLHMEYKYVLELLRSGLYDEYYENFKNCLIPFLDPGVYGRSILENSSFIASSVHPDKKLHGTGFQSRLTGASSEVMSMWGYMTSGQKPFCQDEKGNLNLEIKPVLPGWLFSEAEKKIVSYRGSGEEVITLPANTFAFNFLGTVFTVLHNDRRKDTFGPTAAGISRIVLKKGADTIEIDGGVIAQPYAEQIRDGAMDRIDIFFE